MPQTSEATPAAGPPTGPGAVGINLGWLLVERAVRLAVNFLVAVALARHLGPGDFGLLSYCLALVGLLAFLPEMGLEATVKRDLLRSPAETAAILAAAARLRLWGAVAGGLALLVVGRLFISGDDREAGVLAVLGLTLLQPILWVPELGFHARGEARLSARAQTLAVGVGALLRIALIAADAALVWFAVAAVAEMVVAAGMLTAMAARAGMRWWRAPVQAERVGRLFRDSWPLLLAGAAVVVYMRIDQVMLRQLAGDAEAGIYAAAVRVSEAVYFVPVALVTALLPWWARQRAAGGLEYDCALLRLHEGAVAAAYAFAVPISLVAGWLAGRLYGPAFAGVGPVLAWHVWAGLFVFSGVVRSQEWVFADLNRQTLWTTLAGAVGNVLLNLWLIPPYGARGAAIATVLSYAGAAWLLGFVHPRTRATAARQARALLVPLTGWRYLKRP